MSALVIVLLLAAVLVLIATAAHQIIGKPVEIQGTFFSNTSPSGILYICIPDTTPCNAYQFNVIRDRVLLATGNVVYVKHPERWFHFKKSTRKITQIIERYSRGYKEIRIIAGSLGAKVALAAEASMDMPVGCKITNYLISPSLGPGDVRWVQMFTSGFGSNRKVIVDPELDVVSVKKYNEDVKKHRLLLFSQLLASFVSISSPIDLAFKTIIIKSLGDWLTNTDKAAIKFIRKISPNCKVITLPLRTHCDFLKEAHIYCAYFKEVFSK